MEDLLDPDALDPLLEKNGVPQPVSASVWRSWSENAPEDLRELFDERTLGCLKGVRSQYPAECGPNHPRYSDLRRDCVNALNRLSETIQGESDEPVD